jgi:hypothetical protein
VDGVMKVVNTSLTVNHLDTPVSVQVLRSLKPWQFLNRKIFLSVMAIQHYEESGAFDEPAIYLIKAYKFGNYRLFKYKQEAVDERQTPVP